MKRRLTMLTLAAVAMVASVAGAKPGAVTEDTKAMVAEVIGHPVAAVMAKDTLGPPTKSAGTKYQWIVDKRTKDTDSYLAYHIEAKHGYKCTITLTADKQGIVRKSQVKGNDDGCLYLAMRYSAPPPGSE